jgi:ParB family transcriptional regulator, chromosome partitioning protein
MWIEAVAGPRIFARGRVRAGATGSRIGRGPSQKEPKMAQPSFALLEVDKIDIEEGFNARTDFDEAALDRLAASIAEAGVVQPILVRPRDNGRYFLVAGERRLRGARKSQIKQIHGLIREGATRAEAIRDSLLENMHREDLNDVDQARGVQALAEEWELRTNKEVADKLGLGVDRVGLLRRILKLPDGVQRYIADGTVPVKAEKQLREVAAVSPRIAECVCEYAARKEIEHVDFVREFADILLGTSRARFTDPPTMIRADRVELKRAVDDKVRRRDLIDRFNAAVPWEHLASEDPVIAFKDAEVDAARAAHRLVEHLADHRQFVRPVRLVTDAKLAVDLIERHVEAMEADAVERAKSESDAADGDEDKASLSEQRKAEHKKREEDKVTAEGFNELLLSGLMNRSAADRRKHRLARKKAIAKILLANNPDLAGAGIRFVHPALQDIEVKTQKKGEPRKKVRYAEPRNAASWLSGRIDDARSEAEVDDLLTEAILCALLADNKAVARSRRFGWHCRVAGEVRELLAAEIEEVSPTPRSRKSAGAKKKAAVK